VTICLKCRTVSHRSAEYCGTCGGAFRGLRCSAGHLSPGYARRTFCPTCRTQDVTQAVASLNLGFVTRIGAWVLALFTLKYGFAHLGDLFHAAGPLVEWVVGRCIVSFLGSLITLCLTLWVFIRCIGVFNPKYANQIDPFPKLVPALWKGMVKVLGWGGRTLFFLVEGRALPSSKDKKRKSKDGH